MFERIIEQQKRIKTADRAHHCFYIKNFIELHHITDNEDYKDYLVAANTITCRMIIVTYPLHPIEYELLDPHQFHCLQYTRKFPNLAL